MVSISVKCQSAFIYYNAICSVNIIVTENNEWETMMTNIITQTSLYRNIETNPNWCC